MTPSTANLAQSVSPQSTSCHNPRPPTNPCHSLALEASPFLSRPSGHDRAASLAPHCRCIPSSTLRSFTATYHPELISAASTSISSPLTSNGVRRRSGTAHAANRCLPPLLSLAEQTVPWTATHPVISTCASSCTLSVLTCFLAHHTRLSQLSVSPLRRCNTATHLLDEETEHDRARQRSKVAEPHNSPPLSFLPRVYLLLHTTVVLTHLSFCTGTEPELALEQHIRGTSSVRRRQ